MTRSELTTILRKFNANKTASINVVERHEAESGVRLPKDYEEFLLEVNGGEGFIGNAYVILWRVEELVELNRAYHVKEYLPGILLIGTDGGGQAYGIDFNDPKKPIVMVPFIGMARESVVPVAQTFDQLLEKLFKDGTPFPK